MTLGRIVTVTVIVGGLLFAVLGGEYSALDSWNLEQQTQTEQEAIDALTVEIDSLTHYADSIETRADTQERVARERFGMIRRGEMLYRVEPVEK